MEFKLWNLNSIDPTLGDWHSTNRSKRVFGVYKFKEFNKSRVEWVWGVQNQEVLQEIQELKVYKDTSSLLTSFASVSR